MESKVPGKPSQHRIEHPTSSTARLDVEHFMPDVIVCILKVDTKLFDATYGFGPAVPIQRHRNGTC
jgi:hypothetical protein